MQRRLERITAWIESRRGRKAADAAASPYRAGIRSVTDAPLPRASRWLLMALVLLLVAILAWATLGRIDVTGTAQGTTVVNSRVSPVQAPTQGVVREVLVEQGDEVSRGDALIRLEDAGATAEVRELEGKLARARAARARLEGMLAAEANIDFDTDEALAVPQFEVGDRVPGAIARSARALMQSQWQAYVDGIRKLESQRTNRVAQRETAQASLDSIQAALPYLEDKVGRMKQLSSSDSVSRQKLDNARQELTKRRQKMQVRRRQLDEAKAELRLMDQRIAAAQSEFREKRATELADVESRLATARKDLVKARERLEQHVVRSPIDGVVQDVKIHSPGSVVRPTKTLMRVVPADQPVEVRANILNRDIGFAHVGQKVDVKFQAYDFTRYGAVPGEIREIASTSTKNKKLGQVYTALVELKRPYIMVDGERVRLRPGLTATVDIDMGSRRIIEYFLEPLLRYKDKALRER